ncbi:hypothetical protein MRB53_042187 [Persea americana]|nr:hypothetical protein MRB53_042187 [Persea americana]
MVTARDGPQSQAFTPYGNNNDTWRVQSEVVRLQQVQGEHADRIARLERRHDENARLKSVWGNSSPFPSVLSGTPQQAPIQQPPSDSFRNFDDDTSNLISSLHLDAEEEPRRALGATSRANSVRFDESANQNHFSHLARPSFDYLSRTSSSISDSSRSSQDLPSLAPGLLLLGSVPAIIRCWMNLNFKHDALLYAAVCTGSLKSYLHEDLVRSLALKVLIKVTNYNRTIELPVYFPEAIPHPASSRSTSPAPQLPAVTVQFHLFNSSNDHDASIQIFLGSDMLRLHNADILFSSNSMTLYDDERSKLSIPMVRPENENVFNHLRITSEPSTFKSADKTTVANGNDSSDSPTTDMAMAAKCRAPIPAHDNIATTDLPRPSIISSDDTRPGSRASTSSRPSLNIAPRIDTNEEQQSSHRSASGSPAVWSNWRRESSNNVNTPATSALTTPAMTPTTSTGLDWAAASKARDAAYQRKDTGIKVLKPKSASRAFSSSAAATSSSTASSTIDAASPIGEARPVDSSMMVDGSLASMARA